MAETTTKFGSRVETIEKEIAAELKKDKKSRAT